MTNSVLLFGKKDYHPLVFQPLQTIDVKNETQSNDVYLNLPDLEYDDATYNVELYAKSSMAVGEDMWSQFSDTTFTTKRTTLYM